MFAALLLDPRLAFLILCSLLIAAAVPIAFAWARVLPEEPPPFRFHRSSKGGTFDDASSREEQNPQRDPLAIALLLCVTFSYALQLPGLPQGLRLDTVPTIVPDDTLGWIEFALVWFFLAIPGFAAAYAILRPNFLRIPLFTAGVLVLLLWLLSAPLRAALAAVS